jgi:M3 family oligoendopeptidase
MKFKDYTYERPDINQFCDSFNEKLALLDTSDITAQLSIFDELNAMRDDFETANTIARVRHTIDTKDAFYEAENNFFDESSPKFQEVITEFYRKILDNSLRSTLEKKWGSQLFTIASSSLKIFQPSILEDLQEENKNSSEYIKIKSAATIEVEGKTYNILGLAPLEGASDRAIRKKATLAKWAYFESNAPAIEQIFDKLVKTRHAIATKLGYTNFIALGYERMLRSDYNASMVANFRKQVQEHIVPLATRLYERQAKRIGVSRLTIYDEEFKFATGNPIPAGSPEWIVNHATTMYRELSPETDEFFQFMLENDLMDLVNREGKAPAGYCTFIPKYKAPFIFSNFNGTSGDIDVLTHEAGHAFQVYSSRNIGISEYNWPTYESCEIHSMSMEFFTWPWMHLFFEKDVEKYKYMHLSSALQFLPYGVAIDEFQHVIYENPHFTPAERNQAWKSIEQKYLPHRDYDGIAFLESGGFWQKQNHLFNSPFYYIDYCLAQLCAFQFWKKNQENHQTAWADYIRLCKAGGSQSFLGLVQLANLRSPFEDGCIASVIQDINNWLDNVDDTHF